MAGVTAMDCSVAAVTVSVVFAEMLPDDAVMTDVPAARAVARPLAEIVATAVVPEVQVTEAVIFCCVPSEYVPVAVNCSVRSIEMLGFAGVTDMDCSVAAVTVSVVFPAILSNVAVITAMPGATLVAKPLEEMVETPVEPEAQVTDDVMLYVVPSE